MRSLGFQFFTLFFTLANLCACSSELDSGRALLPEIDIECSIASVSQCSSSGAGARVFVGLSRPNDVSCLDRMALVPGSLMAQSFDYSSVTRLQDQGTYLLGVTQEWHAYNHSPQTYFDANLYQLCAFIDWNENGQLDPLEPYHESTFQGGASYSPLSTWEIF